MARSSARVVFKKLDVEYGGEHRTKKSVQSFVDEILAPVNSGTLNPRSTQTISEFVEQVYFPQYVESLRLITRKGYRRCGIEDSTQERLYVMQGVFRELSSERRSAWASSTVSTLCNRQKFRPHANPATRMPE